MISVPNSGKLQLAKEGNVQLLLFAHSIMTTAYHLLTEQEDDKDLGSDYFEVRHQDAIVKQIVRKSEKFGFTGTLAISEAS